MSEISKKRNPFKRCLLAGVSLIMAISLLVTGCGHKSSYDPLKGVETTTINDDYGRVVKVPVDISGIAASGATSQMVLMTLCPELLVGLSSSPTMDQQPYFPEEMWYLPTFGQFYGSKANMNMESLIAAEPQVLIDLGDWKISGTADLDMIQKQTNIPTMFFDGSLEKLPESYRKLGKLLGKEEEAEKLAVYIEDTLAMAEKNSALISENDRKSVMFGTGATGLACNAEGSSQADVIDIIGAKNAIIPDEVTNRGGGTTVSMEEVYNAEPDVIILSAGGPYETMSSSEWSSLKAVQNGAYYQIPNLPYDWMASPPSVNRVLGIWWLGNLLYPDLYDYDMAEKAQEFYKLFWHYDLSEEEAVEMLQKSTLKQ